MPDAVDLTFWASQDRLADPSDDATAAPLNVRSRAELSVEVLFADKSKQLMSLDERATFNVSEDDSRCARIVG
eukprot:CAMPEP_0119339324 /NCGR_PEP_ID=MMETSP1333-20130426/98029_1 /TAXON_ID=418940 /ORGANISM="Scyphosphaera apsteinii, Strain RCC1455" /LENGTH=72 /DNA_ID=CAMNT_0007350821 /DNA_START=1 /DNA_END=215 /DNA_ORIENTATION=+